MLWIFYIVILIILFNFICSKDKRLLRLSEQLNPKTPCLPILGHALYCYGNTEEFLQALNHFGREAIQNGGLTCAWFGNLLYIDVADAVDAEFILRNYLEKGYGIKILREVTGNGSIYAPASIWHPRRKILVPTFKPSNIQKFANTFAKQSKIMVNQMKSKALTMEPFSIWDYITAYTLDSVSESTLGVDLKTQENLDHFFIKALEKGMTLVATRFNRPWLYNDIMYKLSPSYYTLQGMKKDVYNFCYEIITKKRLELATKSCKNTLDQQETSYSFLELLIKSSGDEKGYTDLELLEEILVLIIAGNDTSATAASFTSLMLSRYPDVQQKAYEELREVLKNTDGLLLAKDVSNLKYLDAVIKETLRLYPPVPFIIRFADRDLTLPSGVTIVKGCDFLIDIWALHRNPKYWGLDAEEFRPERWFEMDLKHQAQFMPFSYGPRNCVGYQYAMISVKTAIATMLSHYRILPESSPNKDGVFEPLRLKFELMLKEVNNFKVRLENRNRN